MYFVVIPTHDVEYFKGEAALKEPEVGMDPTRDLNVNGYLFECLLFTCEKEPSDLFSAGAIHGSLDLKEGHKATLLSRPPKNGTDAISIVAADDDCLLGKPNYSAYREKLRVELEPLAAFSGRDVELTAHSTKKMIPPTRDRNVLSIVIGAVPPGFTRTRSTEHLFGVRIIDDGYVARLPAPTDDVGYVVKNDLGEPIAQIVDDTIYLFLSLTEFGIKQLTNPTIRLFRRAMTLAWNKYTEGPDTELPTPTVISTPETYFEQTMNPNNETKRLRKLLDNADEDIANAQQALTRGLARRANLIATIAGTLALRPFDTETAWAQLHTSPYLESIKTTSEGRVYYQSTPLIISDEKGSERFIGSLALSIERPSTIRVWSTDNPHPRGAPHPHVNQYGEVCLGNVTQSVSSLLAEQKEAEAAALILRLLAEGYDPTLAEHRLEEWPSPPEWEEWVRNRPPPIQIRKPTTTDMTLRQERTPDEPITPVPHAEQRPDSSGPTDRSWLDWLLCRTGFGKSRGT